MADTNHIFIIQTALRSCSHSEMLLLAGCLQDSLAQCSPEDLSAAATYCAALQYLADEYEVP